MVRNASLVLAAAALGLPMSASAQERSIETRDARYCEVFELRGARPAIEVTVWNTIGLNDCPAAAWEALQAGPLAAERGATAIVFNGPRRFLMDRASSPTARRELATFGTLRTSRVAAISITTAEDLRQTPYTERTILRDNTWEWKRGREVYELVAPSGARYVMQAYAQIVDRSLTLRSLPRLGERLAPPQGWRYRTRRLKRPLVMRAGGAATIVQDELQNTYQRIGT